MTLVRHPWVDELAADLGVGRVTSGSVDAGPEMLCRLLPDHGARLAAWVPLLLAHRDTLAAQLPWFPSALSLYEAMSPTFAGTELGYSAMSAPDGAVRLSTAVEGPVLELARALWAAIPTLVGWPPAEVSAGGAPGEVTLTFGSPAPWAAAWELLWMPFDSGASFNAGARRLAVVRQQEALEAATRSRLAGALAAAEAAGRQADEANRAAEDALSREQEARGAAEAARAKAEAADARQRGFLKAIAHEVNTPINGLLGVVEVLAGDGVRAPGLERVREASETVLAALAGLHRASAGESVADDVLPSSEDLRPEPASVRPVVARARPDEGLGPESLQGVIATWIRLGGRPEELFGGPAPDPLPARTPWPEFVALVLRGVERFGFDAYAAAFEAEIRAGVFRTLTAAALLLPSPRAFFWHVGRLVMPRQLPGCRFEMSELPDGRIRIIEEVPEDVSGDVATFYAIHSIAIAVSPTLAGYPRADLVLRCEGRVAIMDLTLHAARGWWSEVWRILSLPFAFRVALSGQRRELAELAESVRRHQRAIAGIREAVSRKRAAIDATRASAQLATAARQRAEGARREAERALRATARSTRFREERLSELAPGLRRHTREITEAIADLDIVPNDDVAVLRASARRLVRLVDCALTLGSERWESVQASVALRPWLASASGVAASAPEITVRFAVAPVTLALGELVENARRAGSRVEVKASFDGVTLRLVVADDGPGLTQAEAERFAAQGHASGLSRGADGAGLGLAVAFRVARVEGGSLSFDARGGGRAVFAVPATLVRVDALSSSPEVFEGAAPA